MQRNEDLKIKNRNSEKELSQARETISMTNSTIDTLESLKDSYKQDMSVLRAKNNELNSFKDNINKYLDELINLAKATNLENLKDKIKSLLEKYDEVEKPIATKKVEKPIAKELSGRENVLDFLDEMENKKEIKKVELTKLNF